MLGDAVFALGEGIFLRDGGGLGVRFALICVLWGELGFGTGKCEKEERTMEYIIAPMKGTIRSRILFGHLLGFGSRHSSNGFALAFGGPSDMHRRDPAICLE